ncbi:MAG: LysM peptidoglycan-binding domain-containing protein [Thermodesulfobacteriota bacterium]
MKKSFLLALVLSLAVAGCTIPAQRPVATPKTQPAGPTLTVSTPDPAPAPAPQPLAKPKISAPVDNDSAEAADLAATEAQEDQTPERTVDQVLEQALEFCDQSQVLWQKGQLAEAVDALDRAYGLILEVDPGDSEDVLQQKEDLRYVISRRLMEIYASRQTAATGKETPIPLIDNQFVQAEIRSFTGPERERFMEAYRKSGKYRPLILKKLSENGLPEDLSWLPLIESEFKVSALSPARALGLWQFIPSTGYKYGLMRDQYVDHRLDPEKATDAAIAYLSELHGMFGDWTTCLAAYNCGEGRVARTIASQHINYLDNFWDLYQRLPRETARYVPRFFAALLIIRDPAKYGMDLPDPAAALNFETVDICRQLHLKQIADLTGTTEDALAALNPELRYRVTPPGSYTLRVPPGSSETLLAQIETLTPYTLPVYATARDRQLTHKVRRGETLSSIARRYGVSSEAIKKANRMKRNTVYSGQRLKVPVSRPAMASAATTVIASGKACAAPAKTTHVVQRGDSLWNLASRYNTTVSAIKAENRLSGNSISIGQQLTIPGGEPEVVASSSSAGTRTYQVKPGDTAYSIARKHGMSLDRFLSLNNMSRKKASVFVGQKVLVE